MNFQLLLSTHTHTHTHTHTLFFIQAIYEYNATISIKKPMIFKQENHRNCSSSILMGFRYIVAQKILDSFFFLFQGLGVETTSRK